VSPFFSDPKLEKNVIPTCAKVRPKRAFSGFFGFSGSKKVENFQLSAGASKPAPEHFYVHLGSIGAMFGLFRPPIAKKKYFCG